MDFLQWLHLATKDKKNMSISMSLYMEDIHGRKYNTVPVMNTLPSWSAIGLLG